MPRVKRKPHSVCRKEVCYKCGEKVKSNEVMGPSGRGLVEQALQSSDDPDDPEFSDDPEFWTAYWKQEKHPLALCSTCWTHLCKLRDANFQDPKGIWSKWVIHEAIPLPDSQETSCVCKICKAAHRGRHEENPFGTKPAKLGRPPVLPSSPVLSCPDCGKPATKGDGHTCKASDVVASMKRMAQKVPKAGQMFAAELIQSLPGSPEKGTKRLTRSRGGFPLQVTVPTPGPSKEQNSGSKLSSEKVAAWEATTNMSTNMRNESISFLNKSSETRIFQRNIKAKILRLKAEIKKYFTVTRYETDGKTYPIAHVKDMESYLDFILEKRGPEALHRYLVEGEMMNRFSLDSGGNFLKLSLNLIDMVNARDPDRQAQLSGFHDSGLKGLHIVAIVEDLKESHEAFEEFFRLVKLEKVPFWIAADFKVDNFLAGIQACSSTYACPFCNSTIHEFDTAGSPRTIRRIRQKRDDWVSVDKANPKKLIKHEGCEHYPALPGRGLDKDEEILDIIAPGELHLVLGIVNKVLSEIRVGWKSGIDEWFGSLSLDKKGYQFEDTDFNGRNCSTVLSEVGSLIQETQRAGMFWIQPHLRTLQVLRKVVDACFGFVLDPNYAAYIAEFKNAWQALVDAYPHQFKFHYKIHILVCHVEEFIKRRGPLGPYSEQSGESLHGRWGTHWPRYKNLPRMTPEERLLNALVDFEYRHLSLLNDSSNSSQADEPEPMSWQTTESEPMSPQTSEPDQIDELTTEFEFMSSQ